MTRIVLASGSTSRRAILTGAGIPFTVERPKVDEEALKPTFADLPPADLALALARSKALSVEQTDALIIGADQVMEFDGQAFDKPKTKEELRSRLASMSGKPHHLRGGIVVARNRQVLETIQETSTLWMRTLTDDVIDGYLAAVGDDVLATVGGYALEREGARLFERVEGDFFAILGLSLFPLLNVLRREGALSW
ncbi:MAG: nucleoside triphosphate pyrophosphatase [Pseudomonadota bacterium]